MAETLYENNFNEAFYQFFSESKHFCNKLNQISQNDENNVEMILTLKNNIISGFFLKLPECFITIKKPINYVEIERIHQMHHKFITRHLEIPLILIKEQVYIEKRQLFCNLKLDVIDRNFTMKSLDLLQFNKYVVLIWVKVLPIFYNKILTWIKKIDEKIEEYSIIKEKYEFIIILSDLHFQLPEYRNVHVYGDYNFIPKFVPFTIAYSNMINHSVSILDHYGTLLRSVAVNMFKVNTESLFDLLYHSYLNKNDYLLENLFLKKEENRNLNYQTNSKLFEKFFLSVDTQIKEKFLRKLKNFNILFRIPLKGQIDLNNRFLSSNRGKIFIYSKEKHHTELSSIVKENIEKFQLQSFFRIQAIHTNLKLILSKLIEYIKFKVDRHKIVDYILFKISDCKIPKFSRKTSITIIIQKKQNLPSYFNLEVSHLQIIKNDLNLAFYKNSEFIQIQDIIFSSINQINILNQFKDNVLYKKYKKLSKITGSLFNEVKYFLNYRAIISKYLLYNSEFNLIKEVYGDAQLTYEIKESDHTAFTNIIKSVSGIDLKSDDIKDLNHQPSFSLLIKLNTNKRCYSCSDAIFEEDRQFYCNECQITFCFKCGNHINKSSQGIDRLPHHHNLIFIPRISEYLNNIFAKKLGNNNMIGAQTNNKNHTMICNICSDSRKKYHTRYICLNCEYNNEREDNIDICGKCFKLFQLGHYWENGIDNQEMLEKYEKFVDFSGHNQLHCLLKIYYFSGDYYDY